MSTKIFMLEGREVYTERSRSVYLAVPPSFPPHRRTLSDAITPYPSYGGFRLKTLIALSASPGPFKKRISESSHHPLFA